MSSGSKRFYYVLRSLHDPGRHYVGLTADSMETAENYRAAYMNDRIPVES
jgi:hypothetical protein